MKKTKRCLAVGALVVASGFAELNVLAYSHDSAMLRFTDGGSRTNTLEQLGFPSKMKVLLSGVNIPRPGSHRRASDLAPKISMSFSVGTWRVLERVWVSKGRKRTFRVTTIPLRPS